MGERYGVDLISVYTLLPRRRLVVFRELLGYSHSMVLGGLEEISYTTRLTPFTLLMISLETFAKNS